MNKKVFCDHPKIEQMWRMNFSGNVIPMTWYKTILKENGQPDTTAIILLSEIVYWYRPQEIRDEVTGEFVGLRKRFRHSKYLQKGYQELADTFGFSYQIVQRAVKRLEDIGVIQRVCESLRTEAGMLPNVLFIDLNVDRLAELTYQEQETERLEEDTTTEELKEEQGRAQNIGEQPIKAGKSGEEETPLTPVFEPSRRIISSDNTPCQKRCNGLSAKITPRLISGDNPSYQKRQDGLSGKITHPIKNDSTIKSKMRGHIHRLHIESITKSSSSESTSRFREDHKHVMRKKTIPKTNQQELEELKISRSRMKEIVHTNIQYDELLLNEDKQLTDEIVRVMVDVLCADQETIKVNGTEMPAGIVKSRLLKMTPQQIESVLENMRGVTSRIVNMPRYLLSALYNEATTPHHANQVMVNSILNT